MKDLTKNQLNAIYIAAALFAAYFLYKLIKPKKAAPDDTPYIPDQNGQQTLQISEGDTAYLIERLQKSFYDCWFCPNDRCAALDALNEYNGNELIYIANSYKNSYDTSLKADIESLNYHCSRFGDEPRATLLNKLEALNIN